jgi:hypothetical protein
MILTAADTHPINLVFQVGGGLFYSVAAIRTKDEPLLAIEALAVVIYGSGIIYYFIRIST